MVCEVAQVCRDRLQLLHKATYLELGYKHGYTGAMKTAISLPDDVFEAADELAQTLGVSRSQLYTRALANYLAQHRQSDVTERLNAVYSQIVAEVDPLLHQLQILSIATEEW